MSSIKHLTATRLGALFLFLVSSANAALLTDLAATNGTTYDFIVVGAGTAGNVIANRLTEDSAVKVLVVEAGLNDLDDPTLAIPLLDITVSPDRPWTWNYTAAPQTGLNGRTFPYQRGKVLGGSSSINYLIINKGASSEWDRIAKVTGDSGWSYASMATYLNKWEKFVKPQDGHDISGQYTPSAHGTSGPIEVSLPNFSFAADSMIINATSEVPGFPYNQDVNAGTQLGVGWAPGSSGGGVRWSSSAGYLHANGYINRPNLDVLIGAQVTKLTYKSTSPPVVGGVLFASGPTSTLYTVNASKEVILSAGAVGTPQILQLSGIGPADALSTLHIPVVADIADVGNKLQDHPLLATVYSVNSTNTYDPDLFTNPTKQAQDLQTWTNTKTGPFSVNVGNGVIGWARLDTNNTIFNTSPDPSSGTAAPHVEFAFADGWLSAVESPPTTGNYLSVINVVVSPASRGTIKLSSSSSWDSPIIDPGFFTDPFDIAAMRDVFARARRLLAAPALKGFIIGPHGATADVDPSSQDSVDALIKGFSSTIWHPTSTAAMSKVGDVTGVVDATLKVKGVANLRVVDASVFPFVPAGHPQGFIYTLAERAADIIKAAH